MVDINENADETMSDESENNVRYENNVAKYNGYSLKYSELQAYELVSFVASTKVEHT